MRDRRAGLLLGTAGRYTGEMSAAMLAAEGCTYCIVGHSERRRLFGETDEDVARKSPRSWRPGVTPIVCVGETLEEKQPGVTAQRVACADRRRPRVISTTISARRRGSPTSRCGQSAPASPTIPTAANETIASSALDARRTLPTRPHPLRRIDEGRERRRILRAAEIDGGLVGGASLDPRAFLTLIMNGLKKMWGDRKIAPHRSGRL